MILNSLKLFLAFFKVGLFGWAGGTALNAGNTTVVYSSTAVGLDIMGGNILNRSATVQEEAYPKNTDGNLSYHFVRDGILVTIINNSVLASNVTITLIFN